MPDPVSAAIGGAVGIAQTITGLVNKGKAKREAARLEKSRPKYSIDQGFQQNLDLAESELSTGLSATAENAYSQLQDKQFSSSLDAILKGGGTATNVAEVYGEGQEGRLRLAQLSDQMRVSKINNLMQSREDLAGEEDKKFMYNVDAPWKNAVAANSEARRGADAQIWGGIQSVASTGMQFFDQKNQEKQFDKYLNSGNGGGSQVSSTSYRPASRPNVMLPSSSTSTQNLPRYQSNWQTQQEGDYLSQILNKPV